MFRGGYAGPLCWFAPSVVVIVDEFSDHAPAVSGDFGLRLVAARVGRNPPPGAPDRRVWLGGMQPIVDAVHRATDLGLGVWHMKEPLDIPRDFRL